MRTDKDVREVVHKSCLMGEILGEAEEECG